MIFAGKQVGTYTNPATSCKDLPPCSISGYYWIQSITFNATLEYCEMFPPCNCKATPGWMRVANFDMTDTDQQCPLEFTTQNVNTKRFCSGRASGCSSVVFPINGVRYNKVCGKVIGYQYYSSDAFHPYYNDRTLTIDDVYVDGISLTHGTPPRSHIWTFANALDEVHSNIYVCPCTKTDTPYTGIVPPFIGSDYFCATGSRQFYTAQWYTDNPLWDGKEPAPAVTSTLPRGSVRIFLIIPVMT